MSPDEVRALRDGRTQQQMAALFGVALRTWQDWEAGNRNPKGTAVRLLRYAGEQPRFLDWLKGRIGKDAQG